ncbi:MAG: type III pantothenate kinase [Acidimicrobiia bacterium]
MRSVIDVGNSTISYANFVDGELIDPKRIETSKIQSVEDVKDLINDLKVDESVSFVVSCGVKRIRELLETYFDNENVNEFFISGVNTFGANINYETPETLGSDRVANTIAVANLYDTPCCVIDCGTAINVDVIDETKTFIGGSIRPGLQTSIDALTTFAPSLPKVALTSSLNIVGKNTIQCIQSGVVNVAALSIDAEINELRNLYPNVKAIITGGHADIIHPLLENDVILDIWLTLKGLGLAEI